MLAKYNDILYSYIANKREKNIITRNPKKVDKDFKKEGNIFYKSIISEDELSDIFSVGLLINFNTGLPNTPLHWLVAVDEIKDNKILLRFSKGILPGWDIEEKNVCIKYIDLNEIEDAKIVYLYKKRNGLVCIPPQRVENRIPKSEIIDIIEQYKRTKV